MNNLFFSKRAILITAGIIIVIGVFAVRAIQKKNADTASPVATTTTTQGVDTSLAPQNERSDTQTSHKTTAPGKAINVLKGSASNTLSEGCSLRFSFVPDVKSVTADRDIHYAITVANKGNRTCVNTSFSVYYGDNEKYVSASPKAASNGYYWRIGDLPSNGRYDVSLTTHVQASESQQVLSEACATADNGQDVCGDNAIFTDAPQSGATSANTAVSTGADEAVDIFQGTDTAREKAVWIWDSPIQMSSTYVSQVITTVKKNNFNTIYVTVDDYIPITSIQDQTNRDSKKKAYFQALSLLISKANSNGIAVDIEGGAKDWIYQENRWQAYTLIGLVQEYNQTHPEAKIRGLQFDVEPYLLPEYDKNKAKVLTQFVDFVNDAETRMAQIPGRFSLVIPHFYDSEQAWTPQITYNGTSAYAYTQLLKVLQKRPGSTLIVMAYRNTFDGEDGTRQLAQAEINEAVQGGYATKVIVAQETGSVDPPYVTFHGKSKKELKTAVGQIFSSFKASTNFNGVAINYFDPFLKLK